jgi:hypothetical protein
MADLALIGAVQPVDPECAEIYPVFPSAAILQGDTLAFDASGRATQGKANTAGVTQQFRGIALEKAGTRQGLSCLVRGRISGYDLSALAYGALVYLSDNAGKLGTTASATKTVVLGQVVPMSDALATKVLYINAHQGWTAGY